MRNELERAFIRCARRRQALYEDNVVRLVPKDYASRLSRLDGAKSLIFDIIDAESGDCAGEIALRIGDGAGIFYLGHIGYHIDPPYRGRHAALHACELCTQVFSALNMRSFVITTDVDNLPSIKTCERLGCTLESTVRVPEWCRSEYSISAVKRRYVYEVRNTTFVE